MMDESKRQFYLNSLGIIQWKLHNGATAVTEPLLDKSSDKTPDIVPKLENVEKIVIAEQSTENESTEEVIEEKASDHISNIKGLRLLNQGSSNGLLVVMSEQRKNLSTDARVLMSKMLKGIHFLPSETGFATISEDTSSANESCSLESIKAILALGNEAGRLLVKIAGARIIPGSEIFSLEERKIVTTSHPDDLINNPDDKSQVWSDLKQLVEFFND